MVCLDSFNSCNMDFSIFHPFSVNTAQLLCRLLGGWNNGNCSFYAIVDKVNCLTDSITSMAPVTELFIVRHKYMI